MSEKKTAEIKLRIEPSVKAQWQQSAADEDTELSPYIVRAVTEYQKNQRTGGIGAFATYGCSDSTPLIDDSAWVRDTYAPEFGDSYVTGDVLRIKSTGEKVTVTPVDPVDFTWEPVPTSEGEKKFGSEWKPWTA